MTTMTDSIWNELYSKWSQILESS